jgi:hypothetical protein
MNIFHLHKDPKVCAEYHCDKHVVKMILETAQMLSTAYQKHCGEDTNLYKPAYPKHPMTIWVGESVENFNYAHLLGKELGKQYTNRYGKIHKSSNIINAFHNGRLQNVEDRFPSQYFTPPPQCMPDEYKHKDYITAYKQYYIGEKKRFAKYTGVDTPDFMC